MIFPHSKVLVWEFYLQIYFIFSALKYLTQKQQTNMYINTNKYIVILRDIPNDAFKKISQKIFEKVFSVTKFLHKKQLTNLFIPKI